MLECIAIREKTEGKLTMSNEQQAVASIYMRSGNIDKAIKALMDGLLSRNATGNEADPMRISYYQTLAKCYQLKGDNKNYQQTLEKIIISKDAFYQANSAHAIAELQTKYEVQKKESTIIKQQLAISEKNYWLFGSALFVVMAGIIVWLGFKNYRRKQSIKMQQALEVEKIISAQSIISAEENERKRIAADLHDNLGAYAAAIASNVDHIVIHQNNETALKELKINSQSIVSQLNDTIWVLKKDNLSLTAISDRIKVFIQKINASYPQIKIDVIEQINADILLPPAQAFHLYQIIKEAVSNALKHSTAKNIKVYFESEQQWKITISDDGTGMTALDKKMGNGNGLINMKNRGRETGWHIDWQQNKHTGTSVIIAPTTN